MQHSKQSSSPVCGIALVAEQIGKGADLIFRYPVMPSSEYDESLASSEATTKHSFFSLSPRMMAKLFRTKAPLCNQPMTLLVGETIFCCRSILLPSQSAPTNSQVASGALGSKEETTSTTTSSGESLNSSRSNLVLFSIIVGLLADPFSSSNRLQDPRSNPSNSASSQDPLLSSQSLTNVTNPAVRRIHTCLYRLARALEREEKRCLYVSRQVHRMICIRAQTLQSLKGNSLIAIPSLDVSKFVKESSNENHAVGSAEIKRNEDDITTSLDISSHSAALVTNSSFHPKDETVNVTSPHERHSITESNHNSLSSSSRTTSNVSRNEELVKDLDSYDKPTVIYASGVDNYYQTQESIAQEQAILESLLSEAEVISHDTSIDKSHHIPIFGNLARELAETFYCLCLKPRNAQVGNETTPAILSSGNNCTVYINNHIAMSIEPAFTPIVSFTQATYPETNSVSVPWVRSYHTLIFADYSPNDILQKMQALDLSVSSPEDRACIPQHNNALIKVLQAAGNPFQSLLDLSDSTALPLTTVLDAALTLVRCGYCILAPSFQRSSTAFVTDGNGRSATSSCNLPHNLQNIGNSDGTDAGLKRMRSLSLTFSQRFGPYIPIFLIVSILTATLPTTGLESTESLILLKDEHENRIEDRDNSSIVSDRSTPSFPEYEGQHRICVIEKHSPIKFGHVLKLCSSILLQERSNFPLSHATTNSEAYHSFLRNYNFFIQLLKRTLQQEIVPLGFRNIKSNPRNFNHLDLLDESISTIEEAIICMTTWLYAKKIITCLKNYLVPIKTISKSDEVTTATSQLNTEQVDQNEFLYQQVMESNYITSGMISNTALAWRCGWSSSRMAAFQKYMLRHKNFLLVTRSHSEGDDWGSP